MIAKWIRSYRERSNARKRGGEAFEGSCPLCGNQCLLDCMACKGAQSEQLLQANVQAFVKRREFANSEIMALLGHLRYASPQVRNDFRSELCAILAADFAAANRGKWTGDVALGLSVGHVVGSMFE